jgi:hypothetical protein
MPSFTAAELQAHLSECDAATTSFARGKALEDLVLYAFTCIEGVELHSRNELNVFGTEEVDLLFSNDAAPQGLSFLSLAVLVECKNKQQAADSAEVSYFADRLRHKGCDAGVLVSMNGITGTSDPPTAGYYEISAALQDGVRILVITRQDIEALADARGLVTILRGRYLDLVRTQTFAG